MYAVKLAFLLAGVALILSAEAMRPFVWLAASLAILGGVCLGMAVMV